MAYRSHVALAYNLTGQVLEFYPPTSEVLAEGAPTAAATYKVWAGTASNDSTPLFTGTATLDSVSTTTGAISGVSQARRDSVSLNSTANIVIGRRYLLTNFNSDGSDRMVIVPKAIRAGSAVYHQQDLPKDFGSNSAFVGLRQSFTVDATFITTVSNINIFGGATSVTLNTDGGETDTSAPPYRIEWTYVINGLTRKHWTTFDVCRAALKHNVTIDHVKASMPDVVWMEWSQQEGFDFQPQIEEAFERVKMDIRMAGYDPNCVSDPQVTDRLVTLAARACIAAALGKDDDNKIETQYINAFQKALGTGLKAWMAIDGSGAVAVKPARQLWLSR